jgi:signal transduction histidine kinase
VQKAIEFEIYDTGLGISDNDMSKLFTMFGKLDDLSQINNEDTGLGLFITKSLID